MGIILQPFAWLLLFFYNLFSSYGIALILFAIVVKLVLFPVTLKSKKSMIQTTMLSGKMQQLQKQYGKDKERYNLEIQKLYEREKVNPMGGCLWSFLPMFVLVPLYSIIRMPITYFMGLSEEVLTALREAAISIGYDLDSISGGIRNGYEQIFLSDFITKNWDKLDWRGVEGAGDKLLPMHFDFLGINLGAQPSSGVSNFSWSWPVIGLILIPILAAVLSYVQTIIINKSNGQTQQQGSMKMLNLMMPLMSLWFCFSMPAALGLYWIANSIWMPIREATLGRYYTKKINAEEEEREAKKAAARQLRMEEAKKRAAEQRELEPKKPKKLPQKPPEKKISTTDAGRINERPYARGRSFQADRYEEKE